MSVRRYGAVKHLVPPRLRRLPDHEGFRVYLVDGTRVRGDGRHRALNVDFTMGGTWARYPNFIPDGEIWIDECLSDLDRRATIRHEAREYELMTGRGWSYGRAHEAANRVERAYRRGAGQ